MPPQQTLGVLFGIGAGAIWAAEAILGKMLFQSLTFIQVATSEVVFGTLVAGLYVLLSPWRKVDLHITNIKHLLLIGLVGTVLAPLLYFFGLSNTLAINATLIAHLQPLFVSYFSYYLLKERLHKHDYVASVFILFAVVLITGRTVNNLTSLQFGNLGDLMVFLAMLSWALVAIPGKLMTKKMRGPSIVFFRFLIASCVFIPILLTLGQLVVNSIFQVILGILVGIGYVLYYEGLKRIRTSQIALTELSAPFFTAIFAWFLLGENITMMQLFGMIFLFIGLYILTQN